MKFVALALVSCVLWAQTPVPVPTPIPIPTPTPAPTFDVVSFWNSPDNASLGGVPSKAVFAPGLYIYVRPSDPTQTWHFIATVVVAINQIAVTVNLVADWIPSMANAPDYLGLGTTFPTGTVLTSVNVRMATDAAARAVTPIR